MAFYEIKPEEITAIQKYIEDGDRAILESDVPTRFLNMAEALRRQMNKDLASLYKENARLKRRI